MTFLQTQKYLFKIGSFSLILFLLFMETCRWQSFVVSLFHMSSLQHTSHNFAHNDSTFITSGLSHHFIAGNSNYQHQFPFILYALFFRFLELSPVAQLSTVFPSMLLFIWKEYVSLTMAQTRFQLQGSVKRKKSFTILDGAVGYSICAYYSTK